MKKYFYWTVSWRRHLSHFSQDRRGSMAAEFGLVVPLFFMLILGMIEGGRLMYYTTTLDHHAREGARYASIRGAGSAVPATEDSIEAHVLAESAGLNSAYLDVDVDWTAGNGSGSQVTVITRYPFSFYMGEIFGFNSTVITGESTMTIL